MSEHETTVPEWFEAALALTPTHGDLDVDGTRVHLRTWGEPGRPGLILMHGGVGHGGWWDHIAPFFAQTHYVVAPDYSGHGDSERRPSYHMDYWVDELEAVIRFATTDGESPVHVGHSVGGRSPLILDARKPGLLKRVVALDTILTDHLPAFTLASNRTEPSKPHRLYETKEHAVSRWIPTPARPAPLPFVSAHVAEQSVGAVEGGFTWKFDLDMYNEDTRLGGSLQNSTVPITWMCSEHGLITQQARDEVKRAIGDRVDIIELPAAGHHVMLDQPLVLVAALRTLLATTGH